jgi:hypothetical protein
MFNGTFIDFILNLLVSLIGGFFITTTILKRFPQFSMSYKKMAVLIGLFFAFFFLFCFITFSLIIGAGSPHPFIFIIGLLNAFMLSFFTVHYVAKKISGKDESYKAYLAVISTYILSLAWLLFIIFSLNPVGFYR